MENPWKTMDFLTLSGAFMSVALTAVLWPGCRNSGFLSSGRFL